MPCCLPFCTSDPLALVRLYPTATATTECVYVNTTAVALQHNSDGREQHSSRPATAESSTPADQRRQSAALQQISGRRTEDGQSQTRGPGPRLSQTSELSTQLSAPSLY